MNEPTKWEFVHGAVVDAAYDDTGFINAPGVNGSVMIPDEDAASALVESHNSEIASLRSALAEREKELAELVKDNYNLRRERWKEICESEIFQELKHGKFKHVLYLLQDGQVSVGKAAEAIAEIAHECTPVLPEYTYQENDFMSWKERAESAEKLRDEHFAEIVRAREIIKGQIERSESAEKCLAEAQAEVAHFSKQNIEWAKCAEKWQKRLAEAQEALRKIAELTKRKQLPLTSEINEIAASALGEGEKK